MADHLTGSVPLSTVGNETPWTQNFTHTTISLVSEEKRRSLGGDVRHRAREAGSGWTSSSRPSCAQKRLDAYSSAKAMSQLLRQCCRPGWEDQVPIESPCLQKS